MTELFDAVYIAISGNISFLEAMTLFLLAGVACLLSKKYKIASVIYSVFLILYITLLRREPGYNEIIRLDIRLKNAGVMVGNLLNLLLYMSDGTLWEVQTALFFRWTCLPDCAVPELAADYRRNNRRLS